MNDEIKETLEYKIDFLTKSLNIGIPTKNRRYFNDIKDYITNLQQDNEMYAQLKDEYEEEIKDLQQENERLKQDYINVKNYIKMRNVSTEVEDKALLYNIELENINKKKYLDYKSRCEKASDNLKRNYWINEHEHNDDVVNLSINILQNGDSNEVNK